MKLNQAAQRALTSLNGEIGSILFRGNVVVSIGPDGVVGTIGFQFGLYRSPNCLKCGGLRTLRKKARGMNAQKEN